LESTDRILEGAQLDPARLDDLRSRRVLGVECERRVPQALDIVFEAGQLVARTRAVGGRRRRFGVTEVVIGDEAGDRCLELVASACECGILLGRRGSAPFEVRDLVDEIRRPRSGGM
jgi:hypothetical protein